MAKKRTVLENYVHFLLDVEQMDYSPFKVRAFLMRIGVYCKTSQLQNKILFIRIRGSKNGITIEVGNNYFVVRQNNDLHEFHLYCESSKTLLEKLIKHKLLIP